MPLDPGVAPAIAASTGAGTALIVMLLLTGVLNTKRYTDRVERESAYWREAYTKERELSGAKDAAVAAAVRRADEAAEVAKITKDLLEELRRRQSALP